MIYLDYKGMVDKKRPHLGPRAIAANAPISIILVLHPGIQAVDRAAWNAVRTNPVIGWDADKKTYTGSLKDSIREVKSTKSGVDWSQYSVIDFLGEHGIINRTGQPVILESIRLFALAQGPAWETVLEDVTEHLEDVLTGFDGKKTDVATAQGRYTQVLTG